MFWMDNYCVWLPRVYSLKKAKILARVCQPARFLWFAWCILFVLQLYKSNREPKQQLNDGNGYENVTTKVNSRYLKFYHAYSKWQMTFEVKFQRTVSKFRKRKKKLLSCVPVLDKREIRPFHVVLMQRPLRNVQRAWCTCKAVAFLI